MEKQTSFDLNLAIQRWRENLAQSAAFRSENLNELESHLRDSVTMLQRQGLSDEEAFIVATKRLGNAEPLEKEFVKINGQSIWLNRIFWMLIGIQLWGLTSSFTGSMARNGLAFVWSNINYDWKNSGVLLPVTLFALTYLVGIAAALTLCYWLLFRKGQEFAALIGLRLQRKGTFIIYFAGICLLTFCVRCIGYLPLHLIRLSGSATLEMAMYSSYSQAIVGLLQAALMIAVTLAIARKRFRPIRA